MKISKKQKEIIEVAKTLFSKKGFVETSMRDLAAVLEIKAATLYSHFRSKEEILEYICNEVVEGMKDIMHQMEDEKLSVEDKFKHYVSLHIEYAVNRGKSSDIYEKYWNFSEESQKKYGEINAKYIAMVDDLVKHRFPKEKEKNYFIPNSTAIFLMETLNLIPTLVNPQNPDLKKVAEDVLYRLIYGYNKDF